MSWHASTYWNALMNTACDQYARKRCPRCSVVALFWSLSSSRLIGRLGTDFLALIFAESHASKDDALPIRT